jgi:hypothetical protein
MSIGADAAAAEAMNEIFAGKDIYLCFHQSSSRQN